MDPEPSAVPAGGDGADRLSRLGDGALGHILSFLPAEEAARAAALSRRWRHVFAAVHTVSFKKSTRPVPHDDDDDDDDDESHSSGSSDDEDSFSSSSDEENPTSLLPAGAARAFVDAVSAALHGRHRGTHAASAPLRALRLEFPSSNAAAYATAIDGWLHYAIHHAGDELHLDLCLGQSPTTCDRPYLLRRRDGSAPLRRPPEPCEASYYTLPRSLFRCASLRSLSLVSCRLDDPPAAATTIALPSLGTLHLTRVSHATGAVRRLVAGCPRLADLTLEACSNVTELSIISGARLRRLVLRCCHDLTTVVAADMSELRSFEYSGAGPGPSFQTVHVPRRISSCTINFCGEEATRPTEMGFLKIFANATDLHIKSARLGSGVGHGDLSAALELPYFPALRNLELTGMLPEDDVTTVAAVARMLERTPSLKTLSLFFMPEPETPDYACYHEEQLRAAHKLRYNGRMTCGVPEGAATACLRETTREINLVHYQGGRVQRMLAKFLLCNAMVVDEVYCEFARGPLFIQTKLMEEITGWVMNKSANMMFF
ncbi:hypothetical protein HU200_025085 [Digitaria exilis]|uniref:F-box domain-containing protein n=1 Tax=Digitaria exilis TaxID=1010633 RepID=A0A835C0G4_9POAL|nr:hypothetical protein HU200_025085 [Digitaria exilis]